MDIALLSRDEDGERTPVKVRYDETVTLLIVPMSQPDALKIEKRATKKKWVKRIALDILDPDLAAKLWGEAALRGWEGLTKDGKPFPYNDENRDFLMVEMPGLNEFVANTSMDLRKLEEERLAREKEKAEKKSETTSEPEQTPQD